jgi:transcriptional regulator with XRE-family HTH domain
MSEDYSLNRLPILIAFGDTIRRLRLEKGYSQEKFAELCELDRTYIGGIERGERNIGLLNVYRIVGALGIKTSALFEYIEKYEQ